MANRPVFVVSTMAPYYNEENTEFQYYSGFAEAQKQRSIASLHSSFNAKYPALSVLEVSTKSTEVLGQRLSAFNLKLTLNGKQYPLESVFQSSKVFKCGGPYTDLLDVPAYVSKKDERLKNSGELITFRCNGVEFPLEPKTYFYDWLYINAVHENAELRNAILRYEAFTDIEFNPQKSINCQARSAAIYTSLSSLGLLDKVLESKEAFLKIVYGDKEASEEPEQMTFEL